MHGHGPSPLAGEPIVVAPEIHRRRWAVLAVLSLSLLLTSIDHTIMNVALPSMQVELGATNSQLQWIIDAYTIVFAGLVLTAGALGDRFGRRGALQLGLLVFLAGSMAAAVAGSAGMVIAARAVMGAGGALIMPATLSILTNVFSDAGERGRAIGIWTGVAGIGVALGPITGGYLLEHFSWSSVLWINVPVVIAALIAGRIVLPRSRARDVHRLDPVGAMLSIGALGSLVYAVIEAPAHGWTSATSLVWFGGAAALVSAFIAWETNHDEPMLDVSFFANPRFSAASLSITLVFFAMTGTVFLVTQHLQVVLAYSPLEAGFGILPAAIALFLASPAGAHLAGRFGSRATVTTGLVIAALGLGTAASQTDASSYLPVGVGLTLLGLGLGFAMSPATDSIMSSVPADQAGVGSGVNDTTREFGAALGVAVVGSVAGSVYRGDVTEALRGTGLPAGTVDAISDSVGAATQTIAGLDPVSAGEVASAATDAFVSALQAGLWVASGVALAGAVVAAVFLPSQRTTSTGHTEADSPQHHPALDDVEPSTIPL